MERKMQVPHNRLTFGNEEENAAASVIRSAFWAGGARLSAMEKDLCKIFAAFLAVAFGSGLAVGGAVLTGDEGRASFIREWRDYMDKSAHAHRLNDKMTDIEAALVSCQLQRLPDMLAARRRIAEFYNKSFKSLPDVALPSDTPNRVWYRYVLQLPPARAN